MTAATVLLLATNGPQGPSEDQVSPGLAGFLTVFLLALATWFLMRSMVKHLRKVRYGPGPEGQDRSHPAGDAEAEVPTRAAEDDGGPPAR